MANEWVFTNNGVSRTVGAISNSDTIITVEFQQGSQFPNPGVDQKGKVTLEDRRNGIIEICNLTSRSGDQLTVERGVEGTVAQSWPDATNISCRMTAEAYNDMQAQVEEVRDDIEQVLGADIVTTILKIIYPVDSLYISTTPTIPAEISALGTWVAHAAGEALVGVGNNGDFNWVRNQQRGSETHALSDSEIPAHFHTVDPPNTNTTSDSHNHSFSATTSTDSHNHTYDVNSSGQGPTNALMKNQGGVTSNSTSSDSHNHSVSGTTGSDSHSHSVNIAEFNSSTVGSGNAHTNVQASIAVHVWKRTA